MINKIAFFLSFIVLISWSANAQNKELKGIVRDEQNLPIPGVNVLISGTSAGTVTDMDGSFTISQPTGQGTQLEFSFIGYTKKSVVIGTQTTFNIQMEPDMNALKEVVVVGYGTQKKKDLTGAVASANLEAFRKAPNVNIVQSLQGSVAGLNIGQVNSAGSTPSIQIRGQNTFQGNRNVLIVLDGIQYNGSLASINPNDIESIEVLKDASSATVYGAQAGNGVLLITSKKGKKGKPVITYSQSYASQTPTNKLRTLNREEFVEKVRDLNYDQAFLAPNYTTPNPNFDITSVMDFTMVDQNTNTLKNNNFNWLDAGTNSGQIQKHELSISGASDNSNYLISAGITKQEGFIINDNFKRKNIRVNLETKPTDWLTVGVQSFGAFNDYSGAEPTLSSLTRQSPFLTPYDENGNLVLSPTQTNVLNPFLTYDVENYDTQNDFYGNFYGIINFPFVKGLSYRVNYGNNYRIGESFGASKYEAGQTGAAYKNHTRYSDYTLDNIVNYKRNFGLHDFDVTLLYGAIERENSSTEANSTDISNLIMGYNSLEQGINQFASSGAWKESLNYQMGRVNYKFKDRYLLTGTVRRDGYSGFARNEKWGIFPAAAVGWIVSEESFLKDNKVINFLKLRANYGTTGNTPGRYSSLATFSRGRSYVFGDGGAPVFGQNANNLENPNLRWEKNTGINLGLDFGLLSKRLSGTVEYYESTTKDLFFNVPLPYIMGITTTRTNIGELKNKGFEIQLTSENIKSDNFLWTTTATLSSNRNKIIKLVGLDEDGDGQEDDLVANGQFIGKSAGAIFGFAYDGLYQIGDEIPAGYSPGTQRIRDTNGDGVISAADRIILGRTEAAYTASLLNTFSYKGLTLNVFFNSVQGGKDGYLADVIPTNVGGVRNDNSIRYNYFSDINYWSPRNPTGEFPRSLVTAAQGATIYRDRSFIRLQDISLSYNFDKKIASHLGLSDLNLFVSGKNLATWTKWKGWDPETGQGYNENGRPVMKSYSLGINITF